MPRNGAGTFSVINPIVVGALRSSSAVNANFTDMGDEITNSMALDGQSTMEGQLLANDGTALAPGMTFATDTNTGFRRAGSDDMRWVGGGSDRATMDANGKLTLANGLSVVGPVSGASGKLNPQTLAGTGSPRAVLRRLENDTDEHEVASYESGSGAGAKGSLRLVGGGANDVAKMLFYVNNVKAFEYTSTLFTHDLDTAFGSKVQADTDGFFDFTELTAAPSAPASNQIRAYAKDDGTGTTRLYYKDNAGNERIFQPPVDRQTFTGSSTWTKPTGGQTMALVECWGGGGSGSRVTNWQSITITNGVTSTSSGDLGGAGGGGGGYSRRLIRLDLMSAQVSVVVGAGGAAATSNATSNDGSSSNFGAYLSVGGGAGGEVFGDSSGCDGGGGGGATGDGGDEDAQALGGPPRAFLGSDTWGGDVTALKKGSAGASNPFGGASGGIDGNDGEVSLMGGGGGGSGAATFDNGGVGGTSLYGGAGGGGGVGSNGTAGAGGTSIFGGNGGAGATGAVAGTAGEAPGGGGGGSEDANSGAGARGEVRITCW